MKLFFAIVMLMIIGGGALWAKGNVIKVEGGYKIKQTHTYYESKVSWGEGYNDHTDATPITGIAVLAVGVDWTYSAVTDVDGKFKVKVKPNAPFKLKISDGNTWAEYDSELAGIVEGTTFSELQ